MADTVSVFGLYTTASTTAEAELITDRKRVYNAEKETSKLQKDKATTERKIWQEAKNTKQAPASDV